MASVNKVTTTVLPTVARTTGETSDFYSPSPTSLPTTDPSQPADSVSTSPALNDTTSSFPLSNTADYIARDAFLNSSATGGTEGSSITSSASLSPSTTGFNATTEPFSGSSAWNVTTSTPGLPDISDGLTGQGDVVNTTASAGDVVSTTLPPTPSSSVLWSSPPVISASSVPGNGTIGTGSAGKACFLLLVFIGSEQVYNFIAVLLWGGGDTYHTHTHTHTHTCARARTHVHKRTHACTQKERERGLGEN